MIVLLQSQTPIFKDKARLSPHYIPPILPHREKQITFLLEAFREVLATPKSPMRIVQVIGPVGAGKTSSCIRFSERMEAESQKQSTGLKIVYVNLKLHGSSRVLLYRYLVQRAAPEVYSTSLGAEELLLQLINQLQAKKEYAILILDEIDYFLKHTKEPHTIYDLTRLDEFLRPGESSGIIGMIFTARSREFYRELDQAELSTLGRIPIEFPVYEAQQIRQILLDRVNEAFQPGAVSTEIVDYIADITVGPMAGGDMRYALDLMLFSGELAVNEGLSKITTEHVRKIVSETLPGATLDDISNLPKQSQLALFAVVRALKTKKTPYVKLREVRRNYGVVCEEYHVKTSDDVEESLQDLHDRGIIDIKSLTEIGINGVSAESLGNFLDHLLKKVKQVIDDL